MAVADFKTGKVDTRRVSGRRDVHYNSLDDLLADAQRLTAGPHHTLGNWSLGMILGHLAQAVNMGIDGSSIHAPWPIRVAAAVLMKKRFLRGPIRPGFQLPKKAQGGFLPQPCSAEEGLAKLTAAIERWKREPQRQPHPIFGRMTPEEWDALELRHAELHMSFVVPD
jgi:hypothetical protein